MNTVQTRERTLTAPSNTGRTHEASDGWLAVELTLLAITIIMVSIGVGYVAWLFLHG